MLRVMDAPGYCTALPWGASAEEGGDRSTQQGAPATRWQTHLVSMRPSPWGGYAQSKGATGTRSNAIGARALYSPLSPPASSYTWPFIRARWRYRPRSTPRASTSERPARGAVLYTSQSRPCIEHKGPPSTKNMHTKDGHDSRGRNYKAAETQLPTFAWASLPI